MKISITFDLGEVEVDSDTGHGEIEHLWIDGEDFVGRPAADLVLAIVGRRRFMSRLAEIEHDPTAKDDIRRRA